MPKVRKALTKKVRIAPSRKFRIGNRKSGKSAHYMTTDELNGHIEKGGKGAVKARAVLEMRQAA